jgi:hypothetical protein
MGCDHETTSTIDPRDTETGPENGSLSLTVPVCKAVENLPVSAIHDASDKTISSLVINSILPTWYCVTVLMRTGFPTRMGL